MRALARRTQLLDLMFVDGAARDHLRAVRVLRSPRVLAWLLVPVAERIAWRIGAIDSPNDAQPARRTRPRSSAGWRSSSESSSPAILFLPWAEQTQALLVGAVVIVVVGVLDDVFDLTRC